MGDEPQFCVVTPVRNGEKYLAETIESILAQTLPHWHYVIVDGKSEDRSVEIADSYAKKDSRITLISEPDQGMYDALFKGFERSDAPVCCWINSDDKLLPWAFEVVAKYMNLTGADWVTGVAAGWDQEGLLHVVWPPLWYPRLFIRLGFCHGRFMGWIQQESTFFRRKLLAGLSETAVAAIRRQKLAGDFLLWVEFAKSTPLHLLPTVIGGFRVHAGGMTANPAAYYEEISKAGYRVPPAFVGKLARLVFRPISMAVGFRCAARWFRRINQR